MLRKASCDACASITTKFERRVARDLWGDARTSFNAPTRRKKERRAIIEMPDVDNQTRNFAIPAREYPAGFVFYKMCKAGLLSGLPESVDVSAIWQMVVIEDNKRRERFIASNPDKKLTISFRHVPNEFGRMLAKIGYCQILTALDIDDFRPICVPYILGQKQNLSYIVGGTMDNQNPEPENGYSLSTTGFGSLSRLMLVALVRLYANTHAPGYHIVVGDVLGIEKVARVLAKLGIENVRLSHRNEARGSAHREHWEPDADPLPFWTT